MQNCLYASPRAATRLLGRHLVTVSPRAVTPCPSAAPIYSSLGLALRTPLLGFSLSYGTQANSSVLPSFYRACGYISCIYDSSFPWHLCAVRLRTDGVAGGREGPPVPCMLGACTVGPDEARGPCQMTLPVLLILPTATCPLTHRREVEEKETM